MTPEAVIEQAERIIERQAKREDRHFRLGVASLLAFATILTLAWLTLLVGGTVWLLS